MPRCPLCGGDGASPSWLPHVVYRGRRFEYVECGRCRSSFCDPMPDAEVLASMYGSNYAVEAQSAYEVGDEQGGDRALAVLDARSPGVFVDFGCGEGKLLVDAAARSWTAVGVELDAAIVEKLRARLGLRILTYEEAASVPPLADVLHAGDVLEHLTDVDTQLHGLLRLLKPGGLFVAQGPLEANTNLFSALLRWWGRRRPDRASEMPPWHVLVATAEGQRALFARAGIRPLAFEVSEVDWPAPSSLSRSDWRDPRRVVLYAVRRMSRLLTRIGPAHWGNHYFYVGTRADDS